MPSILNATTSSGLVTSADNSGSLQLATNNGTTAVTITTAQNVGIGTTSPISNGGYGGLSLNGTSGSLFSMMTNGTESSRFASLDNETSVQCKASTGYISFVQGVSGGTERGRFTSAGVLQVGNNNGTGEVFAQNTVKVWGVINAGPTTYYNSFGTSSLTKIGTGIFAVGFSRTLGSSRYGVGLTQYSSGFSFINSETTTSCRINTTNSSNSATDADVQFLIVGSS
jgi:hypothetical protein